VSPLLNPTLEGKTFLWIAGITNITMLNKKDKTHPRPKSP